MHASALPLTRTDQQSSHRLAPSNRDIVIANGFGRFHMIHAASELHRHGRLQRCFTGFYPTSDYRAFLSGTQLDRVPRLSRLLDRRACLPNQFVCSAPGLEGIYFAGTRIGSDRISQLARRMFGRRVGQYLSTSKARLFHYRSGYGHNAVEQAHSAGIFALCDHSIAHPEMLEYIVAHDGRFPAPDVSLDISRLWSDVANDIQKADAVVVCSKFVRDTFVHMGYDSSRLHLVNYGVDEDFIVHLDDLAQQTECNTNADTLRIVFAGQIGYRKGVSFLVSALEGITDVHWILDLVGPVDKDIAAHHQGFLADPRVRPLGVLSRRGLAECLLNADVFLFPSLAEGSARVVFDALAAGCYVITTPNAGSIVEDGVHGTLVKPGDVRSIQNAVRTAATDRARISKVGRQNAAEVRCYWRQSQYGERLFQLYDKLIACRSLRRIT